MPPVTRVIPFSTDATAIYITLSTLFGFIFFISLVRLITVVITCRQKSALLYRQQYRILFFIFTTLISLGRLIYFLILTIEQLKHALIDELQGLFNFLDVLPGLFYVNIYFSVLLAWVDTYYHIRRLSISNERKSNEEEVGYSVVILRIAFGLVNFILLILMITGAVCCVLYQSDRLSTERYYIYLEVSFMFVAIISFAVAFVFGFYGISLYIALKKLLGNNVLLNMRVRKDGGRFSGDVVIVKVVSVTIVCVIVLTLRLVNYAYQVQYWTDKQRGGGQTNYLDGKNGIVLQFIYFVILEVIPMILLLVIMFTHSRVRDKSQRESLYYGTDNN
jgi:hypothetical protein